jgi:hypothetical protein
VQKRQCNRHEHGFGSADSDRGVDGKVTGCGFDSTDSGRGVDREVSAFLRRSLYEMSPCGKAL